MSLRLQDCTARIWHALNGNCLFVLSGHTGRVNRVTVDLAGARAVTVSDDCTARVWSVDNGLCTQTLAGHSSWLSDAVINREATQVVTAAGDGRGALWDVATGQRLLWLEGHGQEVRVLLYYTRYRAGRSACLPACTGGTAAGQYARPPHASGSLLPSLKASRCARFCLCPPPVSVHATTWQGAAKQREVWCAMMVHAQVRSLALSARGRFVVTASDDGTARLWDLQVGHRPAGLP